MGTLAEAKRERTIHMDSAVKKKVKSSFGMDPGKIQIGENSALQAMGARAMAKGNRIEFAPGEYNPHDREGMKVLGHELEHLRAQAKGEVPMGEGVLESPRFEKNADSAGESFATGTLSAGETVSQMAGETAPAQMTKKKKNPVVPAATPHKMQSGGTPAGLDTASDFKTIKDTPINGGGNATTVAQVAQETGAPAFLKTGTVREAEMDAATLLNSAGAYWESVVNPQSSWSIDTPEVRGLTDRERNAYRGKLGAGGEQSLDLGRNIHTHLENTPDEALDTMSVYGMAKGVTAKKAMQQKQQGKQQADHDKAMGYVTVMDMIMGNADRLYGLYNDVNWLEERDEGGGHIHLIDNVYESGPDSLGRWQETGDAWMGKMLKLTGAKRGVGVGVYNAVQEMAMDDIGNLVGTPMDFARGVKSGFSSLPALHASLEHQFNRGGAMTGMQGEMLRRIKTLNDLQDPTMHGIYQAIYDAEEKRRMEKEPTKQAALDKEIKDLGKMLEAARSDFIMRQYGANSSQMYGASRVKAIPQRTPGQTMQAAPAVSAAPTAAPAAAPKKKKSRNPFKKLFGKG